MITPAFELTQDLDFLTVTIRVPYTRTSEFDLYMNGEDLKFYAKPYFLRLHLPGRIVEDGRGSSTFDVDKGVFTVIVAKEIPGQHFEGLQMLTALLAPKGLRSARPLVEEIAETFTMEGEGGSDDDNVEFDWLIQQTPYKEIASEELNCLCKYGFGNKRTGVFTRLQDELSDVVDVKNPDRTSVAERRQGRLEAEHNKFDPDHYLADLFEDFAIQNLLKYKPWWRGSSSKYKKNKNGSFEELKDAAVIFTEDEKEQLRKFSNKSFLLDKNETLHVWIGLIDILLAYAYEIRVCEGEKNVESSWNIRKLSGTLSWLETYSSIQEVFVSFGRRVMCYPLYRHFDLVLKAKEDLGLIFQLGKATILKCLLDIHRVFRESDPAYILNDLYISDYCIWIQKAKSKNIMNLTDLLRDTNIRKEDLELELEELEKAALLVLEEEESATSPDTSKTEEQQNLICCKDTIEFSSKSSRDTERFHPEKEYSVSLACSSKKNEEESLNKLSGRSQENTTSFAVSTTSDTNQSMDQMAPSRQILSDEDKDKMISESLSRNLVEELGDKLNSVVSISEDSTHDISESCAADAKEESLVDFSLTNPSLTQRQILEVCPKRDPQLLLVHTTKDNEES
uniref:Protein SHQ1 homolog n=1 Tax=Erpetoichthys calabaricus TaxID=27687 RepID=A0A8C4XFG7_ERPCA